MTSVKHTAVYAQEVKASKNKDDLVFISYDFIRIAKKMILENDDCLLKRSFEFEHNGLNLKVDALCENNITLMDTFNSYKNASFSHREIF